MLGGMLWAFVVGLVVLLVWRIIWLECEESEKEKMIWDKYRAMQYRCELAEHAARPYPSDLQLEKEINDWNKDVDRFRGELGSEINNRVALQMKTGRRKGDENDPDVAYWSGILYGLRIAEEMANKHWVYPGRVRKEDPPNPHSQAAAARGVRS
jgi:hypothetical protein